MENTDSNIFIFVGIIMLGGALGYHYSTPVGYMAVGSGFILNGILNKFLKTFK